MKSLITGWLLPTAALFLFPALFLSACGRTLVNRLEETIPPEAAATPTNNH